MKLEIPPYIFEWNEIKQELKVKRKMQQAVIELGVNGSDSNAKLRWGNNKLFKYDLNTDINTEEYNFATKKWEKMAVAASDQKSAAKTDLKAEKIYGFYTAAEIQKFEGKAEEGKLPRAVLDVLFLKDTGVVALAVTAIKEAYGANITTAIAVLQLIVDSHSHQKSPPNFSQVPSTQAKLSLEKLTNIIFNKNVTVPRFSHMGAHTIQRADAVGYPVERPMPQIEVLVGKLIPQSSTPATKKAVVKKVQEVTVDYLKRTIQELTAELKNVNQVMANIKAAGGGSGNPLHAIRFNNSAATSTPQTAATDQKHKPPQNRK